jgi:hypothetical protein
VAITLEEFQLKLKSEIVAVTAKDGVALARVDAAVAASQRRLDGLRSAHARVAEASRQAALVQAAADSALASAKPEQRAAAQAAAKRAQAAASKAAAREEASASKLGEAQKGHAALVAAKPGLVSLAKASAEAKREAKEAASALGKMGQGVSAAGGPLGPLLSQLELFKSIGFAGAVGLAAGAVVVLTAAVLAGVAALASYGLAAAGAARDARILADALTGSAELGAEFNSVVTQLASKVPLARGQIADLARELSLMRLGRRDMQAGLTAIAITTSAIGDAAGSVIKGVVQSSAAMKRFTLGARNMWGEYQGLAGSGLQSMDVLSALAKQLGVGVGEVEKRLRLGQVKLKDGMLALEAATQARFGKTIAAQMLSVNTQFTKAKENLASMVSGVDLEPALKGLESLLSIFDESTVAGSVLKTLLNEGLGGVSRALGALLPLGKDFFLELAIGAMEVYLAVRPIARQIRDWVSPLLTAENAALAGKVAAYALAAAFGVVAVSAALAIAMITLPFVLAGVAIWALVKAAQTAWNALGEMGREAARWIIEGLVGGIIAGVAPVLSAVANLGTALADKFASVLKIGSPSKVFFDYGVNVDEGAEGGIEAGAGDVQRAVDDMAPVPPGGAGSMLARIGGGGGTYSVHIENLYLGGQRATEQDAASVADAIRQLLQSGLGAAGAGEPIGVPA